MNRTIVFMCSLIVIAAAGFAESETLFLEQALALARQNFPELRVARINIQSAEKAVGVAGLWKKPRLNFEVGGLGWDNDLFSQGEYTVGLSHEFQLEQVELAQAFDGVAKHRYEAGSNSELDVVPAEVALGAGYRYEASGEINTFVFSKSMPLNFNKRGHIEHAAGILQADSILASRDEFRRKPD